MVSIEACKMFNSYFALVFFYKTDLNLKKKKKKRFPLYIRPGSLESEPGTGVRCLTCEEWTFKRRRAGRQHRAKVGTSKVRIPPWPGPDPMPGVPHVGPSLAEREKRGQRGTQLSRKNK